MYNNDTIVKNENQPEFLSDKKPNGEERPWREKKMFNEQLKESYMRVGIENKAERASYCGSNLMFRVNENGKMKLHSAHFCQLRLCAMCSWRREMKIFSQLAKVTDRAEEQGYRFILLTLTMENVDGCDLNNAIDELISGFKRLFELKDVEKMEKGFFRALEITHDTHRTITKSMYKEKKEYYDNRNLKVKDLNSNFNKYHPHLHVMIAVDKSYFTNPNQYISQPKWANLWQQSLRVAYTPIVDVRAIKNNGNKGVKEVAKYTVKDTDFIIKEDKQLTNETVQVLDNALYKRRLVAYGGIMKEIHKELNLDDNESADVHIDEDGEILSDDEPFVLKRFKWHVGFCNYVYVNTIEN